MKNLAKFDHPALNQALEKEFISSICNNLKIEADIYTVKAIKEFIAHILQKDYTRFIVELFKIDSSYKKPMQLIAELAEKFKEETKQELFKDVEEKSIKLVAKVIKTFSDLQKIAWQQDSLSVVLIEKHKLNFTKFKDKQGNQYFTEKEIKTLLEVADFQKWFYYFENADIYQLEARLIINAKAKRTEYYFKSKVEENSTIKKLQNQSKED